MVMVILSGAGWIKEDVLGLHDLADCPAFVCRVAASSFNDILCASLMAQQQGEDVRLQ